MPLGKYFVIFLLCLGIAGPERILHFAVHIPAIVVHFHHHHHAEHTSLLGFIKKHTTGNSHHHDDGHDTFPGSHQHTTDWVQKISFYQKAESWVCNVTDKENNRTYNVIQVLFTSDYHSAIWQPPQV